MKSINKVCREISLAFYILMLYRLWHLCQYGGLRNHLPSLMAGAIGSLIAIILGVFFQKQKEEENSSNHKGHKISSVEIVVFLVMTIYFGSRIIYSAIPFNGAFSWKIDEWMNEKEVELEHNNFFENGMEGILLDLDKALKLPEDLYITDSYQMMFDEQGTIHTIATFMYGRDENGETKTYLINYDADKNDKMTVRINGEANPDYNEDLSLAPMLEVLRNADYESTVKSWSDHYQHERYEILYFGRRSFGTQEGLRYLSGDVDGDGIESGTNNFEQLKAGGEIVGFEVSLHIPALEEVTPVRYIMEPEYISAETLNEVRQAQQEELAKNTESWTVDRADETMYFFLDDSRGWRLVVIDAAAGSRFYGIEKTEDGGLTWDRVNEDPFAGMLGVTEGLLFFDENLGFAGLTGASQSASQLYVTRDGGVTFEKIQLAMETITKLPEHAVEYELTVADYDYLNMPEKEGDALTIKVVPAAGETEGIVFESQDDGATWLYVGIVSD